MKNRILRFCFALSINAMVATTFTVSAERIRGEEICDKFKACTLQILEGQELTDEMKQMVLSQLDQCAVTFADREKTLIDANLKDEANACADEMIEMPCEELMTPNEAKQSKACKALEKASKQAGIEED